ncbi:class I SAM-dependent methyltransferase [Lyngbya confervoides]|uniref:Class I SAM-dependent methyltransferase n=1 Tax=Lyngbya confervoides BDU141951 TaxID=1574623 RepID=A0ABD4T3M3_9CYAN|nr:class I SAM-dependent methyltransferase [Lyngbya confervoides]MCM1983089.1 class I SAM-dependent methyltransferase [Lyngbya confervoides BDU141951]
MTVIATSAPGLATTLVNGLLAIKPLATFAQQRARTMMIKRAESIGVNWTAQAQALRDRGQSQWDQERAQLEDPTLVYPDYYLTAFHAYESGNLSWEAATEVEVAAYAAHARIWSDLGAREGDARLRQSFHAFLRAELPQPPQDILDIGCSVGMSTFALQDAYPEARIIGLDLSPYFLTVAQYRAQQENRAIHWLHRPAEDTGLPEASLDLITLFLICHELPGVATTAILREARRLLRPGGYLAVMDMNPASEVFKTLPPYIFTLLKSTEPYLDEYFNFDFAQSLQAEGFCAPKRQENSPRHRTLLAQAI